MNMSKELIRTIDDARSLARTFHESGLFSDVKTEAQAIVKVIAGMELGLSPFVAMRDLNIIQGKIALAAAQIAALIKQNGASWEVRQMDKTICTLRFTQGGAALKPDISFSMEDAKGLGLDQRDNYKRQPATMLYWRAITKGARIFFPHVFNGAVYTPEELREGRGDIDAVAVEVVAATAAPEPVVSKSEAKRIVATATEVEELADMEALLRLYDNNCWMHRMAGDNAYTGKYLAEMGLAAMEKALKPAYVAKITAADRLCIGWCLQHTAARGEALDRLAPAPVGKLPKAKLAAGLPFEQDGIPDFNNDNI